MDNEVLRNIRTRRSIRRYEPRQISDDELITVLEAGTWAPSGRGKQSPLIIAVQDEKLKARIIELNARVNDSKTNPFYDAPTIVLVFAPDPSEWSNALQDGSLVLGTMMLAASSIGLGSCWINRERELFSTPDGKALMRDLDVPETMIGVGALSLGYPADTPKAAPRKPDYFRIIK